MALRNIPVPLLAPRLPTLASRLIRTAEERIDAFQANARIPAFVPCDYPAAHELLQSLADNYLLRGMRFCEWGSGFGVVADLASILGYDSCGIEIESSLVAEARSLADDFELPVEFVQGSFIPRGAEDQVHTAGIYSWLTTEGDYAYDELDSDIADLDLVFAYPWPDEESVVCDLFDRYAGTGAILATYHGSGEFRLKRKQPPRKRRR